MTGRDDTAARGDDDAYGGDAVYGDEYPYSLGDRDPEYAPDHDIVDRSRADAVVRVKPPVWRRPGRWVTLVSLVFVVLATYYLATLVQVVHTGRSHGAQPADVILVMGAAQYDGRPSPQLARRLDHVVTLWGEGAAPLVMVTGGKQPGDRFTEAEASITYLVERGVPAESIVAESQGRTTYESLSNAAPMLIDRGITDVVVVTDPYHSLRSRLIAEGLGLDVDVAATPSSVVTGWSSVRRHIEEAGGVAVGRLIGFDRLADLTG